MLVRGEDLKAQHVAILDRSNWSGTGHLGGDGNSSGLADGTDYLKARETRKTEKPVTRRPSDALFVMIGADAVTHWLPTQLQRETAMSARDAR
jgi:thioredoxin reductase (NADPH)